MQKNNGMEENWSVMVYQSTNEGLLKVSSSYMSIQIFGESDPNQTESRRFFCNVTRCISVPINLTLLIC